jgi:cell division transport system permease protein
MSGGARRTPIHPGIDPRAWLQRHAQAALGSLGHLARTPLGSLMTAAVIAIALALPGGLLHLLANLQLLEAAWRQPASISLFLHQDLGDEQARALARRIAGSEPGVDVQVVTRAQALEEFRAHSGLAAALDVLEDNPLPALVVVRPRDADPARAEALAKRLRKAPEVEVAQLDLQWLMRLQGLIEIARRGIYLVAGLLTLGVLLICGNTIRLEIQNRRGEIAIEKLVGATDAFVRRPFLYHGLWLGLLGGLGAWLLVAGVMQVLAPAIARVATLYQSDFRLAVPTPREIAVLLGSGALSGWLGAWLAVGRHLGAIEPD